MKKKFIVIFLSGLLSLTINAKTMQAGFSVIDISPDMVHDIKPGKGIQTGGYSNRYAKTLHDKLFVRTVAMRDKNGKTLVIMTADIYKLFPDFGISLIKDWFFKKYDKSKFGLIANSSHTHSAPVPYLKKNPYFTKRFHRACKDSITSAIKDLKPGSLKFALLKTEKLSVSRRRPHPKTGKITFRPDLEKPVDNDLDAFAFYDAKGKLKAILCSYACHATSYPGCPINADYPGAIGRALKERFGQDVITLFAQGAGGDIKPPFYRFYNWRDKKDPNDQKIYKMTTWRVPKEPEMNAYGRKYADYIASGMKNGKFKDVTLNLKMAYAHYEMPLKGGKKFPLYIGKYLLDDKVQIVAMCGEVCHGLGVMVKDYYKKKGLETVFFGYSYHGGTYIPTDKIIKEGGYEARHLKFEPPFSVDKYIMHKVEELEVR